MSDLKITRVVFNEKWMLPYQDAFRKSMHPIFAVWICQYIDNTNIQDVYKWYCNHYGAGNFIKYVPLLTRNSEVVISFIKTIEA